VIDSSNYKKEIKGEKEVINILRKKLNKKILISRTQIFIFYKIIKIYGFKN